MSLAKRIAESLRKADTFPPENVQRPAPDKTDEIQKFCDEFADEQIGSELCKIDVYKRGEFYEITCSIPHCRSVEDPNGTMKQESRDMADEMIAELARRSFGNFELYSVSKAGYKLYTEGY